MTRDPCDPPIRAALREIARQRGRGRSRVTIDYTLIIHPPLCRDVGDALTHLLHDPDDVVRLGTAQLLCELATTIGFALAIGRPPRSSAATMTGNAARPGTQGQAPAEQRPTPMETATFGVTAASAAGSSTPYLRKSGR
jgi:hypothetical protein